MSKCKIYFRADANANIGYGHFVRSLALADMLKDDFDCTFFTQTPTEYQISEMEKVCKYKSLPSDDTKFNIFLDLLKGDEIVVLDNYFYTTDYQKKIKEKGCKLVIIDERIHQSYYTDVLINHLIGVNESDLSCNSGAILLLGPHYALLRKSFRNVKSAFNDKSNEILITMGGSDYNNMTLKIVHFLCNYPRYKVNVLLGDSYKYENTLSDFPITIYKRCSAKEVLDLIINQLLVISTPSTIAYEICSVGRLLMVGSYADNHRYAELQLCSHGLATSCGNLDELTFSTFDELFHKTLENETMISNQKFYFDSKQQSRFIDIFKNKISKL